MIIIRTISAKNPKNGDDGMNWLMFELLWRDFFRYWFSVEIKLTRLLFFCLLSRILNMLQPFSDFSDLSLQNIVRQKNSSMLPQLLLAQVLSLKQELLFIVKAYKNFWLLNQQRALFEQKAVIVALWEHPFLAACLYSFLLKIYACFLMGMSLVVHLS